MKTSNSKFNEEADFLFNIIGANPLPADTKNKRINVGWGEHQNKSVPFELHQSRKEKGEYDNGLAVMTGRLWRGKNENKYLVGIDCDNKKAIDEIFNLFGFNNIEELSNWTWVEQHKDNLDKAHIYILSTKPFKNKGSNQDKIKLESLNDIPAIEVKCERQTMFTVPSMHENGYPYEILGTREPALCDEFELHLDDLFKKYGIEYLDNHEQHKNNNSNDSLPQPVRQLIEMLEIPPNFQYRILEGIRHSTMLSFANSLLIKHKYNNNISREELKKFFIEVNEKLCFPTPLPENEVETIWRDAVKYSEKKIAQLQIINNDEDDTLNYNTAVVLPLEKGDKLLEQEIVQNFVYDIQTNSIDCTLNSKYDLTKIIVPINIKQWNDVRKNFRKLCEEKGIKENHISLLLESTDNNFDLIKKYYLQNKKKYAAVIAEAEERKKQRLELIKEATDFVMAKYRFLTIEEGKDILYYDPKVGVYIYGGEIIIEKELDKKYGFKLKTADITEIKNYVIRKTYVKKDVFDCDVYIINVKNGLLNCNTGELLPHTPDYYSINQKPITYNSNARPTKFLKFLKEVLYLQDIRTAIEIISYTFIRKNLFEYYFILIGTGANGKNVFVGVLSHLHGLKNVSNVSLKSLATYRFAIAQIENKDINVDTELSKNVDISNLKKLTGTQPVMVERKGRDPYDIELWAKYFFNTNELPIITDNSDARHRREIILSFPHQFEDGKNADPELLNKIINDEEEMSGILNLVINSLNVIHNSKKIHVQSTISQRRAKAELTADPVSAFLDIEDWVESTNHAEEYVTKEAFYGEFMKFCNDHKLHVLSYDPFAKKLKKEHKILKGRKIEEDGNGNKKKITIWFLKRLTDEEKADKKYGEEV